jgi:putative membrane protein insertion efficiency factor
MGHRDSSEEQRGARGVSRVDGGFGAVDEKRMNTVMNTSGGGEAKERDRLKSVPPWAVADADTIQKLGGASAAPTDELGKPKAEQSAGVKAALAALRIYKVYLSVLFAGSCRFEPTCSVYMYEAIERFAVMRGSWMGFKRLLRCQPLSRKFGYDPVPEKMDAAEMKTGGSKHQPCRADVAGREAHS